MDTSDTRVTRAQAAALVGVSARTISRWAAAGLITPQRGGWRDPATYSRIEVLKAAGRWDPYIKESNPEPKVDPVT